MGKTVWTSKTLWVNVIGLIALVVQSLTGYIIDIEAQASILAFINVMLRLVTKEPVTWSKTDTGGK